MEKFWIATEIQRFPTPCFTRLPHPMTKKFYSFTLYRWEVNIPIAFLDPIGIVIKEGNYKEGENRRGMFNFYGISIWVN